MPEDESNPKKPIPASDSRIQKFLADIGGAFDGLFGRQTETPSSIATSEIIARLKKLLDGQVRDMGEQGRFVPHIIQIKTEWKKFVTDSSDASDTAGPQKNLKDLENELLAAVIDHINDNRYLTYAPLKITAGEDYFVKGLHIVTSFGEAEKQADEVDLSVTVPNINVSELLPEKQKKPAGETVFAKFALSGMEKEVRLRFDPGERLNVGRTRENDLALEDQAVSKHHASLYFSAGELVVSDVGSANGTFINKERLAYGKAFPIKEGDMVTFGTVDVFFEHLAPEPEEEPAAEEPAAEGPAAEEPTAEEPAPEEPATEEPQETQEGEEQQ